ncbi:hypothetical protein GGI22_005782, partial [Coemansia erecta]
MVTIDNISEGRGAEAEGSSARQDDNAASCSNFHPLEITNDGPVDGRSTDRRLAGDAQSSGNGSNLAGLTNHVVNTLREWYVLASDSIADILEGRLIQQPSKDVWLLGRHYEAARFEQNDVSQGWVDKYPPGFVEDFS